MSNKNRLNTDSVTQDTPRSNLGSQGIVAGTEKRTINTLENNKNLVQYSFSFLSRESKFTVTEENFVLEQLGDSRVKSRIYFIRHGMSIEEEMGKKLQTDEAELSEGAKEQYNGIVKKLLTLGINTGNTYLLHCGETDSGAIVRIRDSAKILNEGLGIMSENTIGSIVGLDTTDKEDEVSARRITITKAYTIDFAHQFSQVLRSSNIENINIICIIHKSNIEGIGEGFFGNEVQTHLPSPLQIETGGIVSIDIDASGNPINYHRRNRWILRFDESNYMEIMEVLKEEKDLEDIFNRFKIGELQIWELQNYINAYFKSKPELYKKYIENNIFRIFCINYLLSTDEYDFIEKFYLSSFCISLSSEEKIILLQYSKRERVRKIIQRLIITRREFWSNNDESVIKRYLGEKEYETIKGNQQMYDKAIKLQGLSLDTMIRDNKLDGAIKRNTYHWGTYPVLKKSYNMIDIDFEEILQSGGKYLLRAHVGQGKSIWLTEFIKYAAIKNRRVLFYEAKELGRLNNKEIGILFSNAKKQGTILCIDAIDEIPMINKGFIKDLIQHFQGNCIITSRESEYSETNDGFITLALKPIDSEFFLKSRFQGDKVGLENVQYILKKSNLDKEVEGNPLLLTLITLLAKMKIQEKEEYKKIGIRSLEEIRNKSDLYENVVRFILTKHAKETKDQLFSIDEDLPNWMNRLDQYAFDIFSGNHQKEMKNYFDYHLGILFRNIGNNQYEFIHKSFYEFFLARYLANLKDGGNDLFKKLSIYGKIGSLNLDEGENSRNIVIFCGKILGNKGKIKQLVKLLGEKGILENDNIFGDQFFTGLEILYTIPERLLKNKLLKNLTLQYYTIFKNWNTEENRKKISRMNEFTENIKYIDDSFSNEKSRKLEAEISKIGISMTHNGLSMKEEIILRFARLGVHEAIIKILKCASILVVDKQLIFAMELYIELTKIGIPEAFNEGLACLEKIKKGT